MDIFESKSQVFWRKISEGFNGLLGKIKKLPRGTKILGAAVAGTLTVVLVLGFLVGDRYSHHGRFTIGGVTFTEDDVRAYEAALLAHLEQNPGTSFESGNLYEVAENDLLTNVALRYYASPEKCDIGVSHEDILIGTRGLLDTVMVEAEFGEFNWTNIRRIRAENTEYRTRLQQCVVRTRNVFKTAITYADPIYFGAGDADAERLFFESVDRLRNDFLPLFEAGAGNAEIAARADMDYYTNGIAGWDGGFWREAYPPVVAMVSDVTADAAYNDDSAFDRPDFVTGVVRLTDEAMALTEVGQHSGVVVAANGEIAIVRLEGITGDFNTWDDMLDKYRAQRRNVLGHARHAIRQIIAKIMPVTEPAQAVPGPPPGWGNTCDAADGNAAKRISFDIIFVDQAGAAVQIDGTSLNIVYQPNDAPCTVSGTTYSPCYGTASCDKTFNGSGNVISGVIYNCMSTGMAATMTLPASLGVTNASIKTNAVAGGADLVQNLSFSGSTLTFSLAAYTNINGLSATADLTIETTQGPEWTTKGETEMKAANDQWGKGHPRTDPREVRRGDTIEWRHKIDIEGEGASGITANTVQSSGVTANITNRSVSGSGMPWETVSWTVPETATDGTIYCQYLKWSPSSKDNDGETTSEVGPPGREQCVEVNVGEEEETCTGTDGNEYPIGDPMCEPDEETGDPGDPPSAPKSAKVFSSHIRAMAIKDGSIDKQAEIACSTGDGTARAYASSQGLGRSGCQNKETAADTSFARPQHMVSFGYEGMLVALNNETTDDSATDQAGNWRNFAPFSLEHTLCGASNDSSEGRNCTPVNPSNGQLTLSALGRPLSPLNLKNRCDLSSLSGLSGAASPNCPGENNINTGSQNIRVSGSGHAVGNADLGKREIKQTVSIQDIVSKKFMNCVEGSIGDYVPDCYQDASDSSPFKYTYSYETGDEDDPTTETDSYTEVRYHWVKRVEAGPIKSTASFSIPYNYTITPSLDFFPANASRIQIGGTELSFQGTLTVGTRYNNEVQETYATATRPDTRWSVVEFYVGPNRTTNPNAGINLQPSGYGVNPCGFYTYDNNGAQGLANVPWGCQSTAGMGSLNQQSETVPFNLWNGSTVDLGFTSRVIADAPIGTKYCVSVAVMDRDSTYNDGYGDISGGFWALTMPECVSIGKVPMTNVIADGLYSDGKIEGAIFEKQPYGVSDSNCATGSSDLCAFGSWGEYEVVANNPGTVKTFASGAALGIGAVGAPLGAPSAYTLLSRDLANNSCRIVPLTFANVGCGAIGNEFSGVSGATAGLARNINFRYADYSGASDPARGISVTNAAGSVSLPGSYTARMNYIKASGNLTINTSTSGLSTIPAGRSIIIYTTGTVTITGQGFQLSDGPYTDISQIPQVMIFAGSINIGPSVTRVDAWLLAGLTGSGSGTINTCSGVMSTSELDGSTCVNPLRIGGPVMASRVLLHRTAGAGVGMPNSARPAEVFYLSPATYLWAYNQSANLSQAFLTYAREVAPRF